MFASLGSPEFFDVVTNIDKPSISLSGNSSVDPLLPFGWKLNLFGNEPRVLSVEGNVDFAKYGKGMKTIADNLHLSAAPAVTFNYNFETMAYRKEAWITPFLRIGTDGCLRANSKIIENADVQASISKSFDKINADAVIDLPMTPNFYDKTSIDLKIANQNSFFALQFPATNPVSRQFVISS